MESAHSQIRRCLPNVATGAVQPVVLREITSATNNKTASHSMPLRSKSISTLRQFLFHAPSSFSTMHLVL
jgi:hypothetical protein